MSGARPILVVVCAALLAGGCGLNDPYATPSRPPAPTRSAPAGGELAPAPTQQSPRPLVVAPARPRATVARFARVWTNWRWSTLAAQVRALRALAAEPLRSTLSDSAAATERNARLAADRTEQRGRIVAIDVGAGKTRRRAVVVVAQQLISHAVLVDEANRYAIYQARLTRGAGGWLISTWTALTP